MKAILAKALLLAVLLAVTFSPVRAADEQELVAILKSQAGAPEKWAACPSLRMIGTAKGVPALGPLLTDERLSQAARHALEALPFPEAETALREALPATSGAIKAGIIESLGWRANQSSVAEIAPLVTDPDTTIASAAAAALGRVGGEKAAAALRRAFAPAPEAV